MAVKRGNMNRYKDDLGNNITMEGLRERRRVEGKERQAYRDSITDEQQLIRLNSRSGNSKKERARLQSRIKAKEN